MLGIYVLKNEESRMMSQLAGLLFSLAFFTPVASAQISVPCTSLWALGFPERNLDSEARCHSFIPSVTALNAGQEMYYKNVSIDDPTVKQYLEWAAETFTYASNKYASFTSVPKIRMVWSDRPYVGGDGVTPAFTYVEFFQMGTEFCPIVLYPDATSFNKEQFQQIVAHEIYHCIQKVNFPSQVSAAVQGGEGTFWFESIAQFMSNDVYPRNDFEYHPMFGSFDQNMPYFQQASPYLAEGFYQSLFWKMGASAANVHAIQAGLRGTIGIEDALAVPESSESFHRYARDLSFNELRDSSGGLAPWRAEKQIVIVPAEASSSFSVSFLDFAIAPFEVTFPKRGRYTLTIHRVDGAKLSVRKASETDWQESFSTSFDTECNQGRKFEGIFTRVSPDLAMNSVRIDIRREERPDCPCMTDTLPADECLFGTWKADNASILEFMRRQMGAAFSVNQVQGEVKLTFSREGRHTWDYQNLVVLGTMNTSTPVDVRWFWNGANIMKYTDGTSSEGTKACMRMVENGARGGATMTARGRTFPLPGYTSRAHGEGDLLYSCNATTFRYRFYAGPTPMDWIFRRQ